jgi:hypothetical protein
VLKRSYKAGSTMGIGAALGGRGHVTAAKTKYGAFSRLAILFIIDLS